MFLKIILIIMGMTFNKIEDVEVKTLYVGGDGSEIKTQYNNAGKPNGNITGFIKDERVYLIDGHHRVSILYVLGFNLVEVKIYE